MKAVCDIPGFVTVYEVASRIGVCHSQVTRYISSGQLAAKKIGNQWFIRERDVKAFRRPPRGNPSFRTGK